MSVQVSSSYPWKLIPISLPNTPHIRVLFRSSLLPLVLVWFVTIESEDCEAAADQETRAKDDEEDD
jgi:hypothetical protein